MTPWSTASSARCSSFPTKDSGSGGTDPGLSKRDGISWSRCTGAWGPLCLLVVYVGGRGYLGPMRARGVPVEGNLFRRERPVSEDQVGRFLRDHHDRRVDIAVGDVGHHRGVHHLQPIEAV